MWNDTRIKELNPDVANLLPEKEIIVAYITTAQTSVQASMQALSAMVPEFDQTVRRLLGVRADRLSWFRIA
jgi:hypothetical protein